MIHQRSLALALAVAAATLAGSLLAQPLVLPGARLSAPSGAPLDPNAPSGERGGPRPVLFKTATEEAVLNRTLRLNGSSGSLRIERVGRSDLRARMIFQGTRLSRAAESCEVGLGEPAPLTAKGRQDGLVRYELQIPSCTIGLDVLSGAVWVKGPSQGCSFEAADCRVDPRGLWGPEPGSLMAQAKGIEQERGQADRAVRENYKALTHRARPQDLRAVVTEQAAFSSEREMMCRSYGREAAHGFCNARFTEARAAQLAARLGLTPGAAAVQSDRRRQAPLSLNQPPFQPPSQE